MKTVVTSSVKKCLGGLALTWLISGAAPGLRADPSPAPPSCPRMPGAFCFRITDIKPVAADVFDIDMEILNWTNQTATSLDLSITSNTPPTIIFGTAYTVANGRPISPPSGAEEDCNQNGVLDGGGPLCGAGCVAPGPPCNEDRNGNLRLDTLRRPFCNMATANNWTASVTSETRVVYTGGTAIPLVNMLDNCIGKSVQEIDARVPCTQPGACQPCTIDEGTGGANQGTGNITPPEAIDDGPEVLDGFVFRVSNIPAPGALGPTTRNTININWFLAHNGVQIGKPGVGNPFGFGLITITRTSSGTPTPPIYFGQTGAATTPLQFFDSVFAVPPVGSYSKIGTAKTLIASGNSIFTFEAGAGITDNFRTLADNVYGAAPNAQIIPEPGSVSTRPLLHTVLMPLVVMTLLAAGIWGLRFRWQ